MISTQIPRCLADLEERFNTAMVSNDVSRITACITDDWMLVTPVAGPVTRARILEVIESGRLTHAAVTGDVTWVTGRGQNTCTFNGAPIQAEEYVTDIYRRVDGNWLCMRTHLTPVRG